MAGLLQIRPIVTEIVRAHVERAQDIIHARVGDYSNGSEYDCSPAVRHHMARQDGVAAAEKYGRDHKHPDTKIAEGVCILGQFKISLRRNLTVQTNDALLRECRVQLQVISLHEKDRAESEAYRKHDGTTEGPKP